MPGEKPEVGVKLVVQNLSSFESEIDRAIQKVQQAKREIEVSLKVTFVANIPQSDLDNVKAQVQRTAKEASSVAVVTFKGQVDQASIQKAAEATARATTTAQAKAATSRVSGVGSVDATATQTIRAREQALQSLSRVERDIERQRVSMMAPRERLEYEYNQKLAEQLILREELKRTGASQAEIDRAGQVMVEEEALFNRKKAEVDTEAANRERVKTESQIASIRKKGDESHLKSLDEEQRLRAEYEKDMETLRTAQAKAAAGAFGIGPGQEDLDRMMQDIIDRENRYTDESAQLADKRRSELQTSLKGFEAEIQRVGASRGQSFYVFKNLEDQYADFQNRLKETSKTFQGVITADQQAQLNLMSNQFKTLYDEGVKQAEANLQNRLSQQYYEKSFMGQLARAETQTYGVRILAGEAQRFGAMLFGAGIGTTVFAQKQVEEYLQGFRVPLGRVRRALGLDEALRESLDDVLLDRAGKQSIQTATDQANAMRIWAEAINVTVDSYEDLINVSAGQEVGLVPQTEMISNVVRLNEGSGTLEQTVTDVAAIMTQYNLATQDAAVQTDNLRLVIGLLDTAASSGLAELNDIGSSMKFFSGRAYDLGITLPEAVATIEMLAQVGLKGSQAGRGLDQLLKSIVAPTPKAAKTFAALLEPFYGPQWRKAFFDEEGTFKGLANFLQEIARATSGMTTQERQMAVAGVGDANAVRTLNALLIRTNEAYAEGIDYLSVLTQLRVGGIQGIEAEVAALERLTGLDFGDMSAVDSYEARLASLRTEIETIYSQSLIQLDTAMLKLGKSMSSTVVPAFEALAKWMGEIADWIEDNPQVAEFILKAGVTGAVAGVGLMAAGSAARIGVDLYALRSAYLATNNTGYPGMVRLMGLNAAQNKTLVEAYKLQPSLEAPQLRALVAASSKAPLGEVAIKDIVAKTATTSGVAAAAVGAGAATKHIQRAATQAAAETAAAAKVTSSAATVAASAAASAASVAGTGGTAAASAAAGIGVGATLRGIAGSIPQVLKSMMSFSVFPMLLIGQELVEQSLEQGLRGLQEEVDNTTRGLRYLNPQLWGGAALPGQMQVPLITMAGQGMLEDFLGFFGLPSPKEVAETFAETFDAPQWLVDFGETKAGEFFAGVGKFAKDFPDDILGSIAEELEQAVYESAQEPDQSIAVKFLNSMTARFLAGLSVAAEQYADDPSVAGRVKSIATVLLSGIAPSKVVEEEALRLQEGRPRVYDNPALYNLYTTAREGPRMPGLSKADIAEMMSEYSGFMYDLYPESEEIGPIIGDLTKDAGEFAAEMRAAGVPVADIETYLGNSTSAINDLNTKAGFTITTLWELVAAAEQLRENLDNTKIERIAMEALRTGEAIDKYLPKGTLFGADTLSIQEDYAKQIEDMAQEMQKLGMPEEEIERIRVAAINALKTIGAAIADQIEQIPAAVFGGSVSNPWYTPPWVVGQGARGIKPAEAAESFEQALVEPRGALALAKLAEAALTSDERKSNEFEDYLDDVAAAFGKGSTEYVAATNNAARANANLAGSAKKTARTFEDIVSELRGMIAGYIKPDQGLTVTAEDMALTELGKYEDGAWEPLRRLASAATDPNTDWKHLLPEGIGVASPEAKAYFETVKAGVERFDPAYSAFFPDKGKIVESVIKDLEGKQREEQYITSVIQEMAAMGYDEKTLRQYFDDPAKELDRSVGYLTTGVGTLDLTVKDSAGATRDLTDKTATNTESLGTLTGSVDEAVRWISSLQSGGKPPEDIPDPNGKVPPPPTIVYNPDIVIPPDGYTPFARGGYVDRPTYALIGEAGPEMVLPLRDTNSAAWGMLSRMSGLATPSRGFVAPQPQINMRTMAPQIGAINMNTTVTSPSPAYVAQSVSRIQRRNAAGLGREILRAAAREGY